MWAHVFFAKNKKYSMVNIASIKNFNRDEQYDKKVYSVELADGSQGKCQVLLLAETVDKLNELVRAKRVAVPKLSQSMFEDEPDATNAKNAQKLTMKKRRNEQSQNRQSATRERRESIVSAHINSKQDNISGPDKERNREDIDIFPLGKKLKTYGSAKKGSKSAATATLTGEGNKDKSKSKNAGSQFRKVAAPMGSHSWQAQREKCGDSSGDETVNGLVASSTPGHEGHNWGSYGFAEKLPRPGTISSGEWDKSKNAGSQSSKLAACIDSQNKQVRKVHSGDTSGDETIVVHTRRNAVADDFPDAQIVTFPAVSPDMFESQENCDSPSEAIIPDTECSDLQREADPKTDEKISDEGAKEHNAELLQENQRLNRKVQALSEKCEKLRQIGLQLRDSYRHLKDSEGFPLTEATGKEIIDMMKELKSLRQEKHAGLETADGSPLMEKVNISPSTQIKKIVLEECRRVRTPAKFVTTMAYGLWGYEALSRRTVRKQINASSKQQLTPSKKEYVAKKLGEWLEEHDYGKRAVFLEMENLNTYLGRAITGAKRHLNRGAATNSDEESGDDVESGNGAVDEDEMDNV